MDFLQLHQLGFTKTELQVLDKFITEMEYERINFKLELSGQSGAKTIFAIPEKRQGLAQPIIFKIGKKHLIDKDEIGYQKAQDLFGGVNYGVRKTEIEQTKILSFTVAGGRDGKLFYDYYLQEQNHQQISSILEGLFEEVIRESPEIIFKPTAGSVFDLYEFRNTNRIFRELQNAGDELPTLLSWWDKCRSGSFPKSCTRFSHGDLHSKNIIVGNERPHVIDFGLTGDKWHYLKDFLKLERDICVLLFPQECDHDHSQLDRLEGLLQKTLKIKPDDSPFLKKAYFSIMTLRKYAERQGSRANNNWEMEYNVGLLYHLIISASNPQLSMVERKHALRFAKTTKSLIEKGLNFEINLDKERSIATREKYAWKIAYSFLRLDQLPSGGWSKTLYDWMDAILEGDHGQYDRSNDMRISGGTDITCIAFYRYIDFSARLLGPRLIPLLHKNNIAEKIFKNIKERTASDGGVGKGARTSGTKVQARTRHSIMGLLTLLYLHSKARTGQKELIIKIAKYLCDCSLTNWKQDKSYPFGMFAAMSRLFDILSTPHKNFPLDELLTENLKTSIKQIIPKLVDSFDAPENNNANPIPTNTSNIRFWKPSYQPYNNFWRMERSGFLFYFPFFLKEDEASFNVIFNEHPPIKHRCCSIFHELIESIQVPFSKDKPEDSMISVLRNPGNFSGKGKAMKDLGASAELLALLNKRPVIELLLSPELDSLINKEDLDKKKEALNLAILHTFDKYCDKPELFKFTTSVSFFQFLQVIEKEVIPQNEIEEMDTALNQLIEIGPNEKSIYAFFKAHICLNGTYNNNVDIKSLIELFLEKLCCGEYFENVHTWDEQIEKSINGPTISFYNEQTGNEYDESYGNSPCVEFVERSVLFLKKSHSNGEHKKILDVGCGPGQYALEFHNRNFKVELVDKSKKMLKLASERLGIQEPPPPRDIYNLTNYFSDQAFDLIFVCATMVHVPRSKVNPIYSSLYRLLKTNGILFINFKIRDNNGFCKYGRFFEYYRNYSDPINDLKTTGFEFQEAIIRYKKHNMYFDTKKLHWANFFFKKI